MNRKDLVDAIAANAKLTKTDADKALKAFTTVVEEQLKKGEKVQLIGFGTFEAKKRSARQGINPRTGEKVKIAASYAPTFKAGKALKVEVNKRRRTTKKA